MADQKLENSQIVVVSVPQGLPTKSTFQLQSAPVTPPQDGEVLLAVKFVSVDPYLRGVLRGTKPGTPLVSGSVAEVLESKHPDWHAGDVVQAYVPWMKFVTSKPSPTWRKVDPKVAPISTAIGVLGMPGRTAYFGLLDVCKPKPNETLLVSGAAGAVGLVVGQIGKIIGLRVIGTAGGPEKCKLLKSVGFDEAIDYKEHNTLDSMRAALTAVAPKGIDCYFDNTGGHVTDAAFDLMNKFGRVAVCGSISVYNAVDTPMVPAFLHKLIYKSVNVRGFVVSEFDDRAAEFYKVVPEWVASGKIQVHETITEGFEQIPDAFIGLFHGSNTGKAVIKV